MLELTLQLVRHRNHLVLCWFRVVSPPASSLAPCGLYLLSPLLSPALPLLVPLSPFSTCRLCPLVPFVSICPLCPLFPMSPLSSCPLCLRIRFDSLSPLSPCPFCFWLMFRCLTRDFCSARAVCKLKSALPTRPASTPSPRHQALHSGSVQSTREELLDRISHSDICCVAGRYKAVLCDNSLAKCIIDNFRQRVALWIFCVSRNQLLISWRCRCG